MTTNSSTSAQHVRQNGSRQNFYKNGVAQRVKGLLEYAEVALEDRKIAPSPGIARGTEELLIVERVLTYSVQYQLPFPHCVEI